jgi:hypothetical protein
MKATTELPSLGQVVSQCALLSDSPFLGTMCKAEGPVVEERTVAAAGEWCIGPTYTCLFVTTGCSIFKNNFFK